MGLLRADRVFPGVFAALLRPPLPLLCLQLPHMPHISECLMKRSLKPTDLRDMTIGQLQVIVNDLHSQIESKWAAWPGAENIEGRGCLVGFSPSGGCLPWADCACAQSRQPQDSSCCLLSSYKMPGALRLVQGSPWLQGLFK